MMKLTPDHICSKIGWCYPEHKLLSSARNIKSYSAIARGLLFKALVPLSFLLSRIALSNNEDLQKLLKGSV